MKRIIIVLIVIVCHCMICKAQVEFSQFKFFVVNLYDFSQLNIEAKFKVVSEKRIKYVTTHYFAINEVGDRIAFQADGDGVFETNRAIKATGPFEPNKKYKKYFGKYRIFGKKPTAFPYRLVIDYMDGTQDRIDITEDNISTYFPCLKWINVDLNSRVIP